MRVYHGTDKRNAERFLAEGIDAHCIHPRLIHGLQDHEPGLFVTPKVHVARRFGLFILQVDIDPKSLHVPPMLRLSGATLEQALAAEFEPQALLVARVEPSAVTLVESCPDGWPSNPFESEGIPAGGSWTPVATDLDA